MMAAIVMLSMLAGCNTGLLGNLGMGQGTGNETGNGSLGDILGGVLGSMLAGAMIRMEK